MLSVDIHGPKLFGFAILDVLAVLGTSLAVSTLSLKWVDGNPLNRFLKTTSALFASAVLTHYYFGIPTKCGYYLGLNDHASLEAYRNSSAYGIYPVPGSVTMWTHNEF
jgi:hypothetical protein